MSFLESLRAALFSLRTNKLRTGLTMLGIISGIAAVIAVVTIGLGGKAAIMQEMEKNGINLFVLYPKSGGTICPPDFGYNTNRLIPFFSISCMIAALPPRPMVTTAITAAIPLIIPSIVSPVRSLLAVSYTHLRAHETRHDLV